MFQKHSIMSLKKKSKSLGHLTALGSHPGSPEVEPKVSRIYVFFEDLCLQEVHFKSKTYSGANNAVCYQTPLTILSLVGTPNIRGIPLILGVSPLKSGVSPLILGVTPLILGVTPLKLGVTPLILGVYP